MLPTNYQNEIINSAMSNRRQYRMIENNNGTVSFVDVTVYDQEGSLFDADDINSICTQVNLNITNIAALEEAIPLDPVTGVKGSAETDFRTGNITLTAANIGTYTRAEIDQLVSTLGGMVIISVQELPTENIRRDAIYLVPSETSKRKNVKDEYINLDGTTEGWELIGSTAIDLTDYYTKTEIDSGALITANEFQILT